MTDTGLGVGPVCVRRTSFEFSPPPSGKPTPLGLLPAITRSRWKNETGSTVIPKNATRACNVCMG